MKHGKKYRAAKAAMGETQLYGPLQAIELIKKNSFASFDETIELAIRLRIKKNQIIRDTFSFPHSFGTESRVLVFAEGDHAEEARKAGAEHVGAQDLVDRVKGGWLDFDVAVATPDMMKSIAVLGPVLGRRGLMPNPKARTVTKEIASTVAELKKGRIEFRSDKTGAISLAIGKCSMEEHVILENTHHVCREILRKKPPETKGHFFQSLTMSATMGPGLAVNIAEIV